MEKGFTLIEALVVLVIVGIFAAFTVPGLRALLAQNELVYKNNALVNAIQLTKAEAIKSGNDTFICATETGLSCGVDWSTGWLIWSDGDADGLLDSPSEVIFFKQGNPALYSLSADSSSVSFDFRGRANSSLEVSINKNSCLVNEDIQKVVRVSSAGRVSTAEGFCGATSSSILERY